MAQDYYEILDVSRDADSAAIKKSYRRAAMKYHPDRNPDDKKAEQKFKEVREAYSVLSDDKKRRMYDQYGHEQFRNASSGGGSGSGGFNSSHFSGGFEDLNSVFGDIFGDGTFSQHGHRSAERQGQDYEYRIQISLEEVAQGVTRTIQVNIPVQCTGCKGKGAKSAKDFKTCRHCNGAGEVRYQQGFFSVQQACSECNGLGKIISKPCPDCRGAGKVNKNKKLDVKIPPGIDTGDRIKLSSEGGAGTQGGPPGSIYIVIEVKSHAIFQRHGNDLLLEIPISFPTAALGDEIEVPTIDGRLKLKIPPGTQSSKQFRLKGKGLHFLRGQGVGDMICRVAVETPVSLTARQKEVMSEFNSLLCEGKHKHSPKKEDWFNTVKDFFSSILSS